MMKTERLETFSDGVFAIAITLLVLGLAVPARDTLKDETLIAALGHQWPSYFAYLVSFLVIGIIWINHHTMFDRVRRVDRLVLFANLALLLVVAAIPFPTRLLSEYLTAGGDARTAAVIYSVTMVGMSIGYSALWLAITRDTRLLHEDLDPAASRAALRRFGLGGIFYLGTVGLALVSPIATLAVHGALALYYCFDHLSTPQQERGPAAANGPRS
jgi:uncharacterized membrane protein